MLAGRDGSHRRPWRAVHHRPTPFPRRGRDFRDWLQTHTPNWTQAARRGGRLGEPEQVYSTTPAPLPSAEGYRITWVHSTAKAARDAATRSDRIEAGITAVEALDAKLAGPRCRFKTRVAVEQAAAAALAGAHADRWVTAAVTQTIAKTYKQARRGRPGPETSYREITTNRFALAADIDLDTSPTTPPATAASHLSLMTATYPTPTYSPRTVTNPTSNGATTYSRASKTPHPCC